MYHKIFRLFISLLLFLIISPAKGNDIQSQVK